METHQQLQKGSLNIYSDLSETASLDLYDYIKSVEHEDEVYLNLMFSCHNVAPVHCKHVLIKLLIRCVFCFSFLLSNQIKILKLLSVQSNTPNI